MLKSSQTSTFPKVGISTYSDFVLHGADSPSRALIGQSTPVLTSPEREDTLQMMM